MAVREEEITKQEIGSIEASSLTSEEEAKAWGNVRSLLEHNTIVKCLRGPILESKWLFKLTNFLVLKNVKSG